MLEPGWKKTAETQSSLFCPFLVVYGLFSQLHDIIVNYFVL